MSLVFEHLFDPESCTFTYVIGDPSFGICALVDPVREEVDRDLAHVDALGRLVHTIETHIHADHVTGGARLASKRGCTPIVHAQAHVTCNAELVQHGDVIRIGSIELHVLETPGHTRESISLYLPKGGAHEGDEVPLVLRRRIHRAHGSPRAASAEAHPRGCSRDLACGKVGSQSV